MKKIIDIVREEVSRDPVIQEVMSRGQLNATAYAKSILPIISEKLWKDVSLQTVVTSVTRVAKGFVGDKTVEFKVDEITTRQPLAEVVFDTKLDNQTVSKVYDFLLKQQDSFINVVQGNNQTNVFVQDNYVDEVVKLVSQEPVFVSRGVSLISLKFDPKYVDSPGAFFVVSQALLRHNIPMLDVVSTYTEMNIFVEGQYYAEAVRVLNGLV